MKRRNWSIREMQDIAKERGGKCLSEKYVHSHSKLRWQCKEGHVWEAVPYTVKYGGWCLECAGSKRLTLKTMQDIAKERGGKCLSEKYVNVDTKLRWQCKEGHVWEARPDTIKNRNHWCPKCAGKAPLTLNEMQDLAKEKGGKCLSKKYIKANQKLRWQCNLKHEWEATPSHIKNNVWCPICSSNVSERITTGLFEAIFNSKFSKSRPLWLVNNRGRRMELDGYNKELEVAFEYQGIQHYKETKFFHQTTSLQMRIDDDLLKEKLCKENGVKLIQIPYLVEHNKIYDFIIEKLNENKILIPRHKKISYLSLEKYLSRDLIEAQEIAEKLGGKCLSTSYVNRKSRLKWQCKEGHVWEAVLSSILLNKTWCPYCAGNNTRTISEVKKEAKRKGGKCLSDIYMGAHSKLRWQCKEGHVWEAPPHSIFNKNTWCPVCSSRKWTLDEMQNIAKKKGGKCLSASYIDAHTKLKWQCEEGHVWEAIPSSIKQGTWCPKWRKHKHS